MKSVFTIVCILCLSLFISCERKVKDVEPNRTSPNLYAIDTSVTFDKSEIKVIVERRPDMTRRVVSNRQGDWVDNSVFEGDEGYYSYNSNEFLIRFEDEKGINRAALNIDLLLAMTEGNNLGDEIGSLKNIIVDKDISFVGVTPKGTLMFKISTVMPRGEGSGVWTIGIYNGEIKYSQVEDEGKMINDAPCLLMQYQNEMGGDINYKNSKFFQ